MQQYRATETMLVWKNPSCYEVCSAATVHGRCTSGGPVENLYPRNSAKLKLGVYILCTRSHLRSACFVHLRVPKKYQVEGTTCSAPYTPDTRNTNRAIEKMTLDVLFRRSLELAVREVPSTPSHPKLNLSDVPPCAVSKICIEIRCARQLQTTFLQNVQEMQNQWTGRHF